MQQPAPKGTYIDGVVANVAGRIILYSELAARMEQARQQGVPVNDSLACTELEDLLYQQLLLEQARIDSVTADPAQVGAELDRRISYFEQQIGGRDKLEKFYGKSITEIKADFRDQVSDQLLVQQMQQKVVGDARVTPKEVERFFKDIPTDSLPFINAGVEYAKISMVAKPTEEEERRVKLRLESYRDAIVKGEKDFCTIAVLYSEDPGSAAQCGELGMVPQGVMVPEFDAVALGLKDGEISPVFKTKYGYHIMEMIDRKGARYNARHILMSAKPDAGDKQNAKDRLDSLMTLVRDGKLDFTKVATEDNDDEDTKGTNGVVIEPNANSSHWAIGDLDQKTFLVLDKLAVGQNVGRGVLQVLVLELVDADHQDGRVFAQHIEHAERRGIHDTVGVLRGNQRDRPWHDQAGHQLVALVGGQRCEIDVHGVSVGGCIACVGEIGLHQ